MGILWWRKRQGDKGYMNLQTDDVRQTNAQDSISKAFKEQFGGGKKP
jgi:hypothetical protein